MTDYESLYFKLFNKMTDIIEELKEAQLMAEEELISSPEPKLRKMTREDDEESDF